MEFNYVNITGDEYKGWLNLFFGEYCVGMVNDVWLADQIRKKIPEKAAYNKAIHTDNEKPTGLCPECLAPYDINGCDHSPLCTHPR